MRSSNVLNYAVLAGALGLALSLLFPPWVTTVGLEGIGKVSSSAGYHFFLAPPDPAQPFYSHGVEIDLGRFGVQVGGISVYLMVMTLLRIKTK